MRELSGLALKCSKHEDIAVRGGVKLAYEYVEMLNNEIKRLKEQNELKNEYLKKISGK